MNEELIISHSISVPGNELEWKAVMACGPGGQNVNKVSSKVELRFDLPNTKILNERQKDRLKRLAGFREDAQGKVIIISQRTRDQHRNLEDALQKLRGMILKAIREIKPRIATKPSINSKRERLNSKKVNSRKKTHRKSVKIIDE